MKRGIKKGCTIAALPEVSNNPKVETTHKPTLFPELHQEKNTDTVKAFPPSSLLDNAITNCNRREKQNLEPKKPTDRKRTEFQYSCHLSRVKGCKVAGIVLRHRRKSTHFKAVRMQCNSIECPDCRKVYFNRKRKEMIHLIEQGFNKFWTLTLSAKEYTTERYDSLTYTEEKRQEVREKSLIDINAAWIKFRALLLKRGIRLKFIRVVEFQKNGVAHLHFLTPNYLPHSLVKKCWNTATKSAFIVHYRKLNGQSKEVANYMSKYMSKGAENFKSFYMTRRRIFARSIRVLCGQSSRYTIWEIVAVEMMFVDAEVKAADLEHEEKFRNLVQQLRSRKNQLFTAPPF